jgi:hypothetical protein
MVAAVRREEIREIENVIEYRARVFSQRRGLRLNRRMTFDRRLRKKRER